MLRPLLSPSQRSQLFIIPTDILEQDLVRRYTFSPADLRLINRQREAHNRLGFAVQLAYLRFPGRPLQAREQVSYSLLSYVSLQLNLSPESFPLYAARDATRREHGAKIQRYLSLRQLAPQDELEIGKRLLPHAVQTGSNFAVIVALLEELRTRKIIIPSFSTVERIADNIQDEATRWLLGDLTEQLTNAHKSLLDGLLSLRDRNQTYLIWLKNFPRRPTPQSVLSVIDRIGHIDSLQLPLSGGNVYENRLSKLARQESRHTPQYIQRLDPIRRYGTLVAIVTELRKDLIDQLIVMHDKMIGQFFNRSEWQQREEFHKRGRAINEKVRMYAKIGKALIAAKDEKSDWQEAISGVMSLEKFRASVEEAETLSMGENFDYLEHLRSRYSYLRQYVPRLLATLPMHATSSAQPLLAAVDLLKQLNQSGKRAVPANAPTEFIKSRWEPYIFQGKGIDRQYYELHVLSELRNYFRSGDLWVAGSREYKRFDTYLLSSTDWDTRKASGQTNLAISLDASGYLSERTHLLHQRLSDINRRITQNDRPEVTLKNGTLHIAKLEKSVPEEAVNLAQKAYNLVPHVKLTDLLVEVDGWTHFSDYFTRDDDGVKGAKEKIVMFSAILADATNLGLRKMAQVCPDVTLKQLAWTSDYYLREETYQKALSEIINFHHLVPFAAYWGNGKTSSSDGQQFPIYSRKGHTAQTNAKYGTSPSAMFYTHISDQYSPYFTQPISATVRDATHVIDGLLHHQTDLQIEEHYTDTAGYTDHVFALCHLLGFRFRPRIRDLADKKLYAVEKPSRYKALEPLIGGKIIERQILSNWSDLLRLAGSIKAGTVTASLMLRKLGAYPRQNSLAYALRELGRIERTLFILDYLEQPKLRLKILTGLNKGEARNALARAVFFYRRGELMDRTWAEQYNSASGLNLVIAAIILWNTVYLARAVESLKKDHKIPEPHLKHISPVAWEHISLTGDYIWNLNQHVRDDGFRPLRIFPQQAAA